MTDLNNISILGHVAIFWAMNHVRELISYVPISVKYFISINQTQICLTTCGRHVTTNSTETCSTVLQLDITSPSCILLIHFVWRLCKTDCTKSWRNKYNTIQEQCTHLMGVKQFAFTDPLLRPLDTLGHREDVLQVLHGRHILRVPHVFITDILQLCIQCWDRWKWLFNPLQTENKQRKIQYTSTVN
jgi:hypothetical protein